MSFSRIKYDNESYDLRINRATGPGDYRLLLESNESCDACLSYDGPRNAKSDISLATHDSTNQWPAMAEVESYLTNRVNKLIDYNSYGKNDYYKNLSTTNKTVCKNKLITEDSRFTNPIEEYRCMDLTSYHYVPFLYVNSQCEIQEDRIGLNSRLKIKDNFNVIKPNPIDQTLALPTPVPLNGPGNMYTSSDIPIDVCKNF
jgi:hypothetical protein